jgi:hypothetical protein
MKRLILVGGIISLLLVLFVMLESFEVENNVMRTLVADIGLWYKGDENNIEAGDLPGPRVAGGFEGSNVYGIKKVKKNHFVVKMKPEEPSDHKYPDHMFYWFYLKVIGAKDETVTIDISNCEWMPSHWDNYKPVYTYANPNDFTDHEWQAINDTRRSGKSFRFTHTFSSDTVHIALRYPYMYSYLQNYIKAMESNPSISAEVLGKTRGGRNIYAMVVTDRRYPNKGKRGIWVISKEHGSEQDGGWVIEGIIRYLLSDNPEAVSLRKNAVFVFVPIAAPDAAYMGRTVNPVTGFDVSHRFSSDRVFAGRPAGMTEETEAIWKRVSSFVKDVGSLDVAITLHNPHGAEDNVWCSYSNQYRVGEHKRFNEAVFKYLGKFTKRVSVMTNQPYRFVFFGRSSLEYGSLGLFYEINQHARGSFLKIEDLHKIGEAFAKGIFDYFDFSSVRKGEAPFGTYENQIQVCS